ncbi:hypothetical protein BJ085DRAFT_41281, partial [Dimargaris cristalligena]
MYWLLASPKIVTLDDGLTPSPPLPAHDPIFRVLSNPDRSLLVAMTSRVLHLWSLQPLALLATEVATEPLIQQTGTFQELVWRPLRHRHRHEFAVLTTGGHVRRYWVVETDRQAYQYQFRTPHYYVPGPGEEGGIRIHTIRIMGTVQLQALRRKPVVGLRATETSILIQTREPSSLTHVPWDIDTPSSPEGHRLIYPCHRLADLPWLGLAGETVGFMERDVWHDSWLWVTEQGTLWLAQLQPILECPPATLTTHHWVGVASRQLPQPVTVSAVSLNSCFSLAAIATTEGAVHLYSYNAAQGRLNPSHCIQLPTPADLPTPSTARPFITALVWSPDGGVLTINTQAAHIYQYSVYGTWLSAFPLAAPPTMKEDSPTGLSKGNQAACSSPSLAGSAPRSPVEPLSPPNRPIVPLYAHLFWDASGTELWVPTIPPENDTLANPTPGSLAQMYNIPFARALLTTQSTLANQRHLILQSSRHLIMGHTSRAQGSEDPDHTTVSPSSSFRGDFSHLMNFPNLADPDAAPHHWPSLESTSNPDLAWNLISYPSMYLSTHWPIRYVAADLTNRYVAIAGRRGFCYYSRGSQKWKMFRNQAAEARFACQGGLVWHHHWLVTAANLNPDATAADPTVLAAAASPFRDNRVRQGRDWEYQKSELRVYSRLLGIDDQHVVYRRALTCPAVRLECQKDCIMVLDYAGHVDEYLIRSDRTPALGGTGSADRSGTTRHRSASQVSSPATPESGSLAEVRSFHLVHVRRWTVNSITPDPWHIRSFSRSLWFPSAVPGSPPCPSLILHVGGRLMTLFLRTPIDTPTHPPPPPSSSLSSLTDTNPTSALTVHTTVLAHRVEWFVASTLQFTPRAAVAW